MKYHSNFLRFKNFMAVKTQTNDFFSQTFKNSYVRF